MNRELEQADIILCPSEFVRDTMLQNGLPQSKCVTLPFGVDKRRFISSAQHPDQPVFVFLGHVGLRKGCQYLFPAFQQVKALFPQARLICVGGIEPEFKPLAERWQGVAEFRGWIPEAEIASVLSTATALVMPSVEEGQARVLNEALAAGLPVVATYESGATSLISDGVEGIIVPSRSVPMLRDALLSLSQTPQRAIEMGKAALSRAAGADSWQAYGDRLIAIYEERLAAIGRRSSHP